MKNFVIPNLDIADPEKLSEYLLNSVEAFSDLTHVPVTCFNTKNEMVKECGSEEKICNLFGIYQDCDSPCRINLASAGLYASRLGEPYIFLCKAGLANIATSLIVGEAVAGYFIAGPIVMGELRSSTIDKFSTLNRLDDQTLSMAKMLATKMCAYEPNEISQLALLFYNCILTSVSGNNAYSALRRQYNEQNKINADIQRYKKANISIEYPRDLEKILISNITSGQTDTAKENISALLNQFSILETGDLEAMKSKTLWFFATAIQVADEHGGNLSRMPDTDLDIISKLNETNSFDQLLRLSTSLVEKITKSMLSSVYNGSSQLIGKALQYINENYRDKITLKDMEAHLYINSSYFSTLFKNEMGTTFTDYINSLRIDHACRLLVETNLSMIDIALSVGFDDQSYFARVFKKVKKVTPKEYRKAHASGIENA